MARYDKYDPISGGFRAAVAVDWPDADLGKVVAVGIDSSGKLVKGAGQSGLTGVCVVTQKPGRVGPLKEVPVVDVMRQGCITDFGPSAGVAGVDFGLAGTKYYAHADGSVDSTATAGTYVGHTVEPDRLEVNFNAA